MTILERDIDCQSDEQILSDAKSRTAIEQGLNMLA